MKLTKKQLIRVIREEAKKDQNKDGKNDFDDVKIAKMKASGMSDEEIKEKHPELFEQKHIVKESEIRALIRSVLKEESSAQGSVELTSQPDRQAISGAWPERVTHNGKNVFDTFYGAPGGGGSSDAFDWLSREGYDGQEVYLGYDPQSDNFVMGFDAFYDEVDEYGYSDPDGMMDGVFILLDPRGRALETITTTPGGVYPEGLRAIRTAMPQIIDVRLD